MNGHSSYQFATVVGGPVPLRNTNLIRVTPLENVGHGITSERREISPNGIETPLPLANIISDNNDSQATEAIEVYTSHTSSNILSSFRNTRSPLISISASSTSPAVQSVETGETVEAIRVAARTSSSISPGFPSNSVIPEATRLLITLSTEEVAILFSNIYFSELIEIVIIHDINGEQLHAISSVTQLNTLYDVCTEEKIEYLYEKIQLWKDAGVPIMLLEPRVHCTPYCWISRTHYHRLMLLIIILIVVTVYYVL
mmetsp:Transcript_33418/g.34056  ORF Transcript_33418/g.34056 Transcript_33418/m.34056 type:complete len:256 (-) Transcript_33418:60-827(-)